MFVTENLIRKGKNEGYPTYWVYLDGVEIGHISKYQMERHCGQVPSEGAAMIAHVPDRASDKERSIYQLRLQMPYRHEPVALKCAKTHAEPVQKKAKKPEASPVPRPVFREREEIDSRIPVASVFINPKPHKKVLPRLGHSIVVEIDSELLQEYGDGSWLWFVARPADGGVSLRLSGRLIGVFIMGDINFSSFDGNVVAGRVQRDDTGEHLEVFI